MPSTVSALYTRPPISGYLTYLQVMNSFLFCVEEEVAGVLCFVSEFEIGHTNSPNNNGPNYLLGWEVDKDEPIPLRVGGGLNVSLGC